MKDKIAVVYQSAPAPTRNGIIKPMKEGGYSDSGADIAFSLRKQGLEIITPAENPDILNDFDWVFPDSSVGIQSALDKGATLIWLNTVLYKGHPVEDFIKKGIKIVGQNPENVELYDDKLYTNALLKKHHLPIPKSIMIEKNSRNTTIDFNFPLVAKPIRGRGSQGVTMVNNPDELSIVFDEMFSSEKYGNAVYIEEFLPGQEITITILPPGEYSINGEIQKKENHWHLPPVKRFNHQNGIAPYNGKVAVIHNSKVLTDEECQDEKIITTCKNCEKAAELVGAKAPIRIDCRANKEGDFFLFDLNMKPNMTGPSRPQRQDQDSLTALAARSIGWDFDALIYNLLSQKWTIKTK